MSSTKEIDLAKIVEREKLFEKTDQGVKDFEKLMSDPSWQPYNTKDGVVISHRAVEGLPHMVRGISMSEHSVDALLKHQLVFTTEERRKWDPNVNYVKLLAKNEENTIQLCQLEVNSPSPMIVSNRDFVYLNRHIVTKDGQHYIASISLMEPNEFLPVSGTIRGHLIGVFMWHFKPINEKTEITFVSHVQPNGWIPDWIVNMTVYDQPLCIARLKKILDTKN